MYRYWTVKLFFHLEGLTAAETAEYIDYRLLVSGHGGNKLFDDETVREIHNLSKGIPRLINKLCDGMMMCAYSEDRPFIDPFDLKGIRKDLLGEDVADSGHKTPLRKRKEPSRETSSVSEAGEWTGSSKALLRIAEALERIDQRLSQIVPEDRHHSNHHSSGDNVNKWDTSRRDV